MEKLRDGLREMHVQSISGGYVLEGPGQGQRHVYKSLLKPGGGYPKEQKN